MFPVSSLSSAEKALHEVAGVNVEVTAYALFQLKFVLLLDDLCKFDFRCENYYHLYLNLLIDA